jgi:hypothetical protein
MRPLVPEDLRRVAPAQPITRAVIATALAATRAVNHPIEVARELFGNDRDVELVLRAAVSPGTIANTPALTQIAKTFLTALIPVSAGADLLGRGIGLSFDGAASISLPNIAVPTSDFVSESAPIPVVQATTSPGPTLVPHKLSVIATVTGEMIRSGNSQALVTDVLIQSTGPAIDRVLLSANAAAADRPAGLLNGITGLTPSVSTGQTKGEILVNDLQALATAVAPVASNGGITLVASPDAAVALVLRLPRAVDWPVLTSASLAARTVIAVAANAVVSAVDGTPEITASQEAEIQSDTAPVTDGSLGTPRYSMFQKDAVALRLRWPISWQLRTPTALAWMTNVNW